MRERGKGRARGRDTREQRIHCSLWGPRGGDAGSLGVPCDSTIHRQACENISPCSKKEKKR